PRPNPGNEDPAPELMRQHARPATPRVGPDGLRRELPTQKEDDEFVGRRAGGLHTAPAARPMVQPGPVAPQTPAVAPLVRPTQPLLAPTTSSPRPVLNKRGRATGDEDELEDLDIQRRKPKGLPDSPLTGGAPRNDRPGDETPRDTSAARR
ncbi:MAG: hypothetical protein N2688_07500, partial [Burkholderiaceae bacterium]|nr:hypothetical protein [Burkholderiaceae bacterium]